MPLAPDRVGPDIFLPWAANLLPENEQLRTLGQLLGMARSDVIGLLSAIGGDTAGGLSLGEPGKNPPASGRPRPTPRAAHDPLAHPPPQTLPRRLDGRAA